ncbi:hypothetical protein IFM5058_05320 [Aspergillus udagawae]|nr:hypothetical protein IFM5058_05320 [Aspergillus udagawae]
MRIQCFLHPQLRAALPRSVQRDLSSRLFARFKTTQNAFKGNGSPAVKPKENNGSLTGSSASTSSPTTHAKTTIRRGPPERILIYHGGTGKVIFLGMLRITTIFLFGVSCLVVAPAFFSDDYPWYIAPAVVAGGALPMLFVAYTSAPFVNFVHLALPVFARRSREQTLQYAKNLPPTATLYINTMKFTTIPRQTEVRLGDLVRDKALLRPTLSLVLYLLLLLLLSLASPPTTSFIIARFLFLLQPPYFFLTLQVNSLLPRTFTSPTTTMASPAKAKPEGILGLSASEAKILILGFLCITDQYKIDYEKLASKGGYTAGSANVMFNKAKRKLVELNPDNSAENGSSAAGEASSSKSATATPKKGQAKRKKAAAGAEDGGADGEEAATPTKSKRQRKTPAKKGAAAKAADDNVENGVPEVKSEPSESDAIIKNEPMEEGNNGSELTVKAEFDKVMNGADLDAELDALNAAEGAVKAEDHIA